MKNNRRKPQPPDIDKWWEKTPFPYREAYKRVYIFNDFGEKIHIWLTEDQKQILEDSYREMEEVTWQAGNEPVKPFPKVDEINIFMARKDMAHCFEFPQIRKIAGNKDRTFSVEECFFHWDQNRGIHICEMETDCLCYDIDPDQMPSCCTVKERGILRSSRRILVNNTTGLLQIHMNQIVSEDGILMSWGNEDWKMLRVKERMAAVQPDGLIRIKVPGTKSRYCLKVIPENIKVDPKRPWVYVRIDSRNTTKIYDLKKGSSRVVKMQFDELLDYFEDYTHKYRKIFGKPNTKVQDISAMVSVNAKRSEIDWFGGKLHPFWQGYRFRFDLEIKLDDFNMDSYKVFQTPKDGLYLCIRENLLKEDREGKAYIFRYSYNSYSHNGRQLPPQKSTQVMILRRDPKTKELIYGYPDLRKLGHLITGKQPFYTSMGFFHRSDVYMESIRVVINERTGKYGRIQFPKQMLEGKGAFIQLYCHAHQHFPVYDADGHQISSAYGWQIQPLYEKSLKMPFDRMFSFDTRKVKTYGLIMKAGTKNQVHPRLKKIGQQSLDKTGAYEIRNGMAKKR